MAPSVPSGEIHSRVPSFVDEESFSVKVGAAMTSTPESRTGHNSHSDDSARVRSPVALTRTSEVSSRWRFSFSRREKPFQRNATASNVTPVDSDCRLTDPYEFDIGEIDSVHSNVGREGVEDFTTESDSTLEEVPHTPPPPIHGLNKFKETKSSGAWTAQYLHRKERGKRLRTLLPPL